MELHLWMLKFLAAMEARFWLRPAGCTAIIRSPCRFFCGINSIPPARIDWLLNGNLVSFGEAGGNSSLAWLRVNSLSYRHIGEIRCQATNPVSAVSVLSESATVEVYGAPEISASSQLVRYILGSTAFLNCSSLANPPATISWSKQGSEATLSHSLRYQSYSNGTLTITNLQVTDSGFYTCTAANVWGSSAYTVLLDAVGKHDRKFKVSLPIMHCYIQLSF